MRWSSFVVLGVVTGACGGEGGITPPDCELPGQVVIEGTLDGEPILMELWGMEFINEVLSTGPHLQITFSDTGGDRLDLEYHPLDRHNKADARGYIDFSESGGLVVGNCQVTSFFSSIEFDEVDGGLTGGTFTMRGLHRMPFCQGDAVDGVLTGCFKLPAP